MKKIILFAALAFALMAPAIAEAKYGGSRGGGSFRSHSSSSFKSHSSPSKSFNNSAKPKATPSKPKPTTQTPAKPPAVAKRTTTTTKTVRTTSPARVNNNYRYQASNFGLSDILMWGAIGYLIGNSGDGGAGGNTYYNVTPEQAGSYTAGQLAELLLCTEDVIKAGKPCKGAPEYADEKASQVKATN